jgi:hypothetical protein
MASAERQHSGSIGRRSLAGSRQPGNVLEQVRAEFHELGREGFYGWVDQVGGAAGGAIIGTDAGDAAGIELGPGEEPWQGTDADAGGNRFAQKEGFRLGSR